MSLVGLVALLLGLAGCKPVYPPMVRAASGVDAPYLIGAGDTLNVVVWRNPELSMTVQVRPDGLITTPLAEDMPASGTTTTQLARDSRS